jgi:hypothetical protein
MVFAVGVVVEEEEEEEEDIDGSAVMFTAAVGWAPLSCSSGDRGVES